MILYKPFLRPLFFRFDPEKIHHFTFKALKKLALAPGMKPLWRRLYQVEDKRLERQFFGLTFKNPVGLAAGFDKDALLVDELECFGFGFIEVGTLTPKAQPGNEKPRLFRLYKDEAIINRMGFNNGGVYAALERLRNRKSKILVGGNIGKNKDTPNEQAFSDYQYCFEALFPVVDYFVVNVSSPNTPNLRALQEKRPLTQLLSGLYQLNRKKENPKPILLKIAPDLSQEQLTDIVDIVKDVKLDGLIATNTTISRDGLASPEKRIEAIGGGGLSGKPLKETSTKVLKFLRSELGSDFPIIAVGGIMSAEDAIEKIEAGASLIQIYTGFIYEGPALVKQINKTLVQHFANSSF